MRSFGLCRCYAKLLAADWLLRWLLVEGNVWVAQARKVKSFLGNSFFTEELG